jgi:hypothetical protein
MKTLNLIKMKKAALGLIIAVVLGSTAFANEKTVFENNIIVTEESETVDSWMTDLSSWRNLRSSTFEVDRENKLELEVWMVNLDAEEWYSDKEEEIEIEEWMVKIADNFLGTEQFEEDLTLETWMLDPSEWLK